MIRPLFHARAALCWAVLASVAPARAADVPLGVPYGAPAVDGFRAPPAGGFRAPAVAVRPRPRRYDIYGYPLLLGVPGPLAAGGCPAAIQPEYDPDGNFAGYAPIPMCR